jgi:hypothetical protein
MTPGIFESSKAVALRMLTWAELRPGDSSIWTASPQKSPESCGDELIAG